MKHKNLLIDLLPMIIDSRKNNISYKLIKEVIANNFNLVVNEKQLAQLVSDFNNDKLKPKYKHLRIAVTSSTELLTHDEIRLNCVRLNNSFELAFFRDNIDIKPENEPTLERIKSLENPVDRIYAKWFTRKFDIHNSELVDFTICSENELQEIQNIPDVIDTVFEHIQSSKLKLIMKL